MTRPRDPLPAHLIRPEDAPAWLADSVNKLITTHWTDEASARSIRRYGVRIEQTERDVTWGQGFYTSSRPRPQYGETSVRVAIRLRHPFVAEDSIEGQERIDALLREAQSDDVRAVLQAAGYDGVVVHFPDGEVWVIAYSDEQVKVVGG